MKIIFCNITYLRFYDGRIAGELKPVKGGRWVRENEDAHEKWNFLNMDSMCYGYVQGNSEQMHVEKMDKKCGDKAEDITVVWCAAKEDGGTVIVGWYEHATAHRYIQELRTTPVTGIERYYWFSTKAKDAYLLPEEKRTFQVGRAQKTGAGTGFGKQNYWFAESEHAREKIIPEVKAFIEANRNCRINTQDEQFDAPKELPPLSRTETELSEDYFESGDIKFLSYGYRAFANGPNADIAYQIGDVLRVQFQYKKAITWYEKTVELDSKDYKTMGMIMYLYNQCEEYDKSIEAANKILELLPVEDDEFRDEVYSVLADANFYKGELDEAISWLDKIIESSKDSELVEFTKETRKIWLG